MKAMSLKLKLLIVIVMGLVLWLALIATYYTLSLRINNDLLDKEADLIEHDYFEILDEIVEQSNAFEYFVLAHTNAPSNEELDNLSLIIYNLNNGIITISFAPNGVISYLYPHNDELLGRNLFTDLNSEAVDDVINARDTKLFTISTILSDDEHTCGGFAFRNPVYDLEDEFVGFINFCVSSEYIFDLMDTIQSDIFDISIYNQYNENVYGDVTYSDDLFSHNKVSSDIDDWYLGLSISEDHEDKLFTNRIYFILLSMAIYATVLFAGIYYYSRSGKLYDEKEKLIYFDKLTSLPNRYHLETDIDELINTNIEFYLGFIDLNNFKHLNDTYGHSTGDLILAEIARLFLKLTNDDLLFYRWGGDEFVFVYKTYERKDVKIFINKLTNLFYPPIKLEDIQCQIFLSIGVSSFPNNANSLEDLIRRADIAMYKVKNFKTQNYLFFEANHMLEFTLQNKFENELELLSFDNYHLYLQPVVNVSTNIINGFESLLRVIDNDGKLLDTQSVINLAEKKGFVQKIDMIIFEKACNFINSLDIQYKDTVIGVNLSVLSLTGESIIKIEETLKATNVNPKNIIIEITETAQIADNTFTINVLNKLRSLGFFIALDDFGSGYSSLNYLANMPITHLKIDKKFIQNYRNKTDFQLLRTMKSLATSLNLKTIAEGIETEDELQMIKDLDIDYYQGYYFGRPISIEETNILLNKKKND